MLALGCALMRRGHQVVLAGPPEFTDDAVPWGINYRPMGRSPEAFLAGNARGIHSTFRLACVIKRDVSMP
jgi:UDP:flavonoid glycosyltransferase YjiC (YdhE family)